MWNIISTPLPTVFPISNGLKYLFPNLVTHEYNEPIYSMSSYQEIKNVIFDMNGDGFSRSDGFSGHFYQAYWDIMMSVVH